jgi:hypothetical protein
MALTQQKITVETIYMAYLSRFPDMAIVLMDSADVVSGPTTMSNLNHYGDNVIILRAIHSSLTRQPTNNQVPVKLSSPDQQERESTDNVKPQWSPENTVARAECPTPHPFPVYDSTLPARDDGVLLTLKGDPEPKPPELTESGPPGGVSGAHSGPHAPIIKTEECKEDSPDQQPILPFKDQGSQEEKAESESIETGDIAGLRNAQLQAICASASPKTLERAVEAGLSLLEPLGDYFEKQVQQTQDSTQWLQQIGKHELFNAEGPSN